MTFEELKAEAERQGYGLHKSMKGICTCVAGREYMLEKGRTKCLRYEPIEPNPKWTCQHCRRKEQNDD